MQTFQYHALNVKGKNQKGILRAKNHEDAQKEIKNRGLFPVQITETNTSLTLHTLQKIKITLPKFSPVSPKNLGTFTRQLSILIEAGIPLTRALQILSAQEKKSSWQKTIAHLIFSIENGTPFSESLAQHPKIFDKLYISMVRAGEAHGDLAEVLTRLADLIEKIHSLKRKIASALIYPAIVSTLALGIVTLLLTFIAPKFKMIFASALPNKSLPLLTQIVIHASSWTQNHISYIAGFAILMILSFKIAEQNPSGKFWIDKIKFKIPVAGDLLLKNTTARFCRVLGTLISSGVPLLQCLLIAQETSNNTFISRTIMLIRNHIKEGEPISTAMRAYKIFPPMVMNMIQVGEETGKLGDMIKKVADIYEEDVRISSNMLSQLLEPMLIIGLALFVGILVVALFLPIVSLITDLTGY